MTMSVVSFGLGSVGASLTGSDDAEAQLADIDPSLTDAANNSESVQAIVMMDDLDHAVIQSQGIDALQAHAEERQQVLRTFAKENDGFEIQNSFWITNAAVVEIDTDQTDLEAVAALNGVEELIRNFDIEAPEPAESSGDVETSDNDEVTYGLDQLDVPEAWNTYDVNGDDATVAVLDTGVDASHPDLDVAQFAEFGEDGEIVSREPFDAARHGTHASGIVSGGDASGQHIGVAPGAELMVGQVLQGENNDGVSSVFGGIQWAVENSADVISMSFGSVPDGEYKYAAVYIDPVRNAMDAGTFVVASSGNGGRDTDGVGDSSSPANVFESIAVGATNPQENVTEFSNGEEINTRDAWGSDAPAEWPRSYIVPDVVAPGLDVKSSIPNGEYSERSGTNVAAPHIAGVVALMVDAAEDANQAYTVEELEEALIESTYKPDGAPFEKDIRYGEGIVDAEKALENIAIPPDPPELGFDLSDEEAERVGDTVRVELSSELGVSEQTSPAPGYAGFETVIEYNQSGLRLVEVRDTDQMQSLVTESDDGRVRIAATDGEEQNQRVVAELVFEVVAEGSFGVEFVEDKTNVSDASGNLMQVEEFNDGVVENDPPDPPMWRDFNEDGEVNIADAMILQQYILGNEVPDGFNEQGADVNADGEINTADLIRFLEQITAIE
jgi:subtilisin family serine protease